MTQGKRKGRKKDSQKSDQTSEVRLKPAGQVQLVPTEIPSKQPPDKRIHARRPLPLIPEKSPTTEKDEGE